MTTVKITDAGGGKPSFTQWDVDRVLYVTGVATQPMLHFSNPELKRALVVQPTLENGRWKCRVPNFILQFPFSFLVRVFVQADEGETVYTQLCRVAPKTKPQDYTYEENIGYVNWVQKTEEIQQMLEDGAFTPEFSIGAVTALVTGEGATASITGTKPNPVLNLGLPKGDTGDPGVYIGSTQPTNPDVDVWIDTTGGSDIEIHNVPAGGSSGQVLTKASGTDYDLEWTTPSGGSTITVDSALSDSSENPVQNKVIKTALDAKGTYSKPSGGIPASDLASAVQTSLGKADTALQSYTETDPTVPSWAKASSKPSYTAAEVGAIAAPSSPATGAFLVYNGSAWVAQTLSTWQGGSY